MTAPVRVLLADDHGAVRAGLRLMLEQSGVLEVVGEAGDGDVAVRQARALRPDVVLMDVRMPGTDGVAATATIVAEGLAEVVALTTFDLDEYVVGMVRAGAAGFLLKSVGAAELVDAVRRVAAGEGVLAPEVTRRLLDAVAGRGGLVPAAQAAVTEEDPRLAPLTARERDVLAGLGEGLSNAGLAERLGVSATTVKSHVSHVLAKLGVRSRLQAGVLARDLLP
ncbi:response regulator [Cellulomonas oligotrophica]|uniref:DNA-binding NarL/FixJ family response regulator n=1 Tax=Cellulomonas oligotrophica TaxID=931536 RepID=A0A7Y9FGF4_9CELL|nr:response regulator transcription factor [Cellulomonas oligotrophica]NYD86904.1 DNA-binding NarL/FixJ family response regulator [Cellulomonas oligotrophica]GIG32310.1 DNA-binding response regulator [Cellulomonas oligotrophica]